MRMLLRDAPNRRIIDNWASPTDNASSWCPAADNPLTSTLIASSRALSVSGRPRYVFQLAQPSAQHTAPWYSCSQRLHFCHRNHLAFNTLPSKLFSSASAYKIFACSAKHDTCTKPAVPRHAHIRTRPSFVFQCKACMQM